MLSGESVKALNDFQKAYDLASFCGENNAKFHLEFRSLLGLAVASSYESEEKATAVIELLQKTIDTFACPYRESSYDSRAAPVPKEREHRRPTSESSETIIGFSWCKEVVLDTADRMERLASLAPRPKTRKELFAIIRSLKTSCIQCCASGEFWKICVAPIQEKWKVWHEKCKSLNLPPDPKWDQIPSPLP